MTIGSQVETISNERIGKMKDIRNQINNLMTKLESENQSNYEY